MFVYFPYNCLYNIESQIGSFFVIPMIKVSIHCSVCSPRNGRIWAQRDVTQTKHCYPYYGNGKKHAKTGIGSRQSFALASLTAQT